jgi:hypothetical protein
MANTVTDTTLHTGNAQVIKYITIASDGTEETDLVIYDSSAIATTLGLTDTSNCKILSIYATVSAASTARVKLEFDANTDVLALDIPANVLVKNDFRPIGGLKNTSSTGKTGDITLTTTGLESGDAITIILCVDPR